MSEYTINFQRLDAYKVAKEFARLVHAARISDDEIRQQVLRASKSAFLQLAEGLPNASPAMRRKYFTCARNSACEVAAAIDLASL
jgi:four helix bundle protein